MVTNFASVLNCMVELGDALEGGGIPPCMVLFVKDTYFFWVMFGGAVLGAGYMTIL